MHECFWRAFETHRPQLIKRWDALLRAEPVTSGMAHPDSLMHLMDWTLDQWSAELRQSRIGRHTETEFNAPPTKSPRSNCPCGKNPLLAYFATAEQAAIEVILVEIREIDHLSPGERNVGLHSLKNALRVVAGREIQTFCAVCQSRAQAESKSAPQREVATASHAA
ncbi:MAG: hypothetical protein SynsKO_05740 [Synoicihabitans sp.]